MLCTLGWPIADVRGKKEKAVKQNLLSLWPHRICMCYKSPVVRTQIVLCEWMKFWVLFLRDVTEKALLGSGTVFDCEMLCLGIPLFKMDRLSRLEHLWTCACSAGDQSFLYTLANLALKLESHLGRSVYSWSSLWSGKNYCKDTPILGLVLYCNT